MAADVVENVVIKLLTRTHKHISKNTHTYIEANVSTGCTQNWHRSTHV